jgi:hypothetical protein
MRQIIAVEAKPCARGRDLYMLPARSDPAVFGATLPDPGRLFHRIAHFSQSPTWSPSSSVFTSLINDPAIHALLMTVAV